MLRVNGADEVGPLASVDGLRMSGICRMNDVVEILDGCGCIRCWLVADGISIGSGEILHQVDDVLNESFVRAAAAGGG